MLRHAHTPEDHARLTAGKYSRDIAQGFRVNAANIGHFLRAEAFQMRTLCVPIFCVAVDVFLIIEAFLHDHMHDGVEHAHIRPGPELQHMAGKAFEGLSARIHDNQLSAAFGELLKIGRRNGMIFDWIGPNDNRNIGVFNLVKGRGYRARADVLHQSCDAGGVAEAGAMIHVVVPETLANEFLEQIGFFIGTFSRTKARNGVAAIGLFEPGQTACGDIQCLFPAGLAEDIAPISRINVEPLGRRIFFAD